MRKLVPLLLLILVGCGIGSSPAPVDMSDIKGKVTLHGAPVKMVTLTFTPVEPGKGQNDVCAVQNGTYETKLIAAKYKVSIEPATGGTAIPAKYRKPGTSGLELDANDSQEKNWELR